MMFLQLHPLFQSGKGRGREALQGAFERTLAFCHPKLCGQVWHQVVGWVARLPLRHQHPHWGICCRKLQLLFLSAQLELYIERYNYKHNVRVYLNGETEAGATAQCSLDV